MVGPVQSGQSAGDVFTTELRDRTKIRWLSGLSFIEVSSAAMVAVGYDLFCSSMEGCFLTFSPVFFSARKSELGEGLVMCRRGNAERTDGSGHEISTSLSISLSIRRIPWAVRSLDILAEFSMFLCTVS